MADVRAAGVCTATEDGVGVASCFATFDEGKPAPNVAKWQSMRNPAVGSRTLHWNDPPENPNTTYGIKSDLSESAATLISPKPLSKFATAIAAAKVPKRKVSNRAPQVMEFLPPHTTFGVKTQSSMSAKECLWPEKQEGDPEIDEEKFRKTMYLKSHRSTLPGEQVERNYSGNFDKYKKMGVETPCDPNGGLVGKTMKWRSGRDANKTQMESERHRAFKTGSHRSSAPVLSSETIFGTASNFDGESVGALITSGNDNDESTLTDTPAKSNDDTVFGIPTVRLDLAPPAHVSVSDKMNYGDQGSTGTVLTPSKLTNRGVSVQDSVRPRTKDEMKIIFEAANLDHELDFEVVWASAAKGRDVVAVEEFISQFSCR